MICQYSLIVMPYFTDSFPIYCLTTVMVFLCAQRQIHGCFYFSRWLMCGGWLLTVSAYLMVLIQWEQGHSWKPLPYHHIYICGANSQPQANFFLLLHCYASGFQVGFLFPVQAQCRLWAPEQYCAQWAGKKLHVATFTSYYARKIPVTSISQQVWLYSSPLDERGKKTFRVHAALPSQINMVVPERDYLCNDQSLKVIKFVVVLSNFQCVWMLRWTR